MADLSVLLTTEGTYPYVGGGVSTWCDLLCRELDEIDFHIMALTGSPVADLRYTLPPNVRSVAQVPLWGMVEPAEHIEPQIGLLGIARRRRDTTEEVVAAKFAPLLATVLAGLDAGAGRGDPAEQGAALAAMAAYFHVHDWGTTWKAQASWEVYCEAVARGRLGGLDPSVWDLTTGLRWLHSFLMPLTVPLPRTTAVHSTIAAFAALPGIVAKVRWGTPFILTEHGVAIRERYLAVAAQADLSAWSGRFLVALSGLVARVAYAHADVISPVADYNRRWEERQGADPLKIRTIHNGVDPGLFVPGPRRAADGRRPTVVAAARVFPLKDIETMIRAAAVTRERVPDVRFVVYGSLDADPAYVERCQALIVELGLDATFEFGGLHDSPTELYREGDISILSSISEGFPYTVLESMACGRPVVATDVGGVREALDGYGIVVPPRDPVALGEAAARLLLDDQLRSELGRRSREAVLARYRVGHSIDAYRLLYEELAAAAGATAA